MDVLPAGNLLCIFRFMACFCDSQINVESGLSHPLLHLDKVQLQVAAAPHRCQLDSHMHDCMLLC